MRPISRLERVSNRIDDGEHPADLDFNDFV